MTSYVVYDTASGAVRWLAVQPSAPTPGAGLAALEVPDGTTLGGARWTVNAGALAAYVPTFADNRAAKAVAAAAAYDGLIAAGFTYAGALYQIDPLSQSRIAAMGIMALGSITDPADSPWVPGFTWITADNSQVAMDAPTMYAFGRAVAAYVSACILNLRAIKTAILSAPDQPTLDAIDVTAGYPAASA